MTSCIAVSAAVAPQLDNSRAQISSRRRRGVRGVSRANRPRTGVVPATLKGFVWDLIYQSALARFTKA
jgi:hypothetical protein